MIGKMPRIRAAIRRKVKTRMRMRMMTKMSACLAGMVEKTGAVVVPTATGASHGDRFHPPPTHTHTPSPMSDGDERGLHRAFSFNSGIIARKRDKGQEKSTEQRKATQGSPKHTEVSVVVVVEMDVVVDVAEVEVNVVVVVWKCPQT